MLYRLNNTALSLNWLNRIQMMNFGPPWSKVATLQQYPATYLLKQVERRGGREIDTGLVIDGYWIVYRTPDILDKLGI